MDRLAQLATGRRSRWVILTAWVVLALGLAPLQGALQRAAADESDAFVAASAESTRASQLIEQRFGEGTEVNTVIAYSRSGGLTAEDRTRIEADAQAICAPGRLSGVVRVITPYGLGCGSLENSVSPSSPAVGPVTPEGDVALVTVQTKDDRTQVVESDVAAIRAIVPADAVVTGETAFAADLSAAFEGIDETLLAITGALILALLLIVYRSPVAAAVPLAIVSLAYLVAAGVIYGLTDAGVIDVTGQATAILIVLMFGAGTDYCLLVVARFKEELGRGSEPQAALTAATRRSAPAILTAGGIVVAAMLVLTLADYRATATMGPVLAVGTAITVAAGLTLLPAMLAILGRRAFWPGRPGGQGRVWASVGGLVRVRPGATILVVGAVLVAGALGALQDRPPLSFAESFRDAPESVTAQELIADRYKPGMLGPAEAVVASADSGIVVEELSRTPGVLSAYATAISRDQKLTLIEIIPTTDPFTEAGQNAVPALRDALHGMAKTQPPVLGGAAAEAYDARIALADDAKLIVPLVLVLVLAIVAVMVRAFVAPLYLVATVVLSYAFALGASSLLFTHVLGQPASDPALPTFAFVFLVALGVDYNVFLISRIREERAHREARDAVISGLERSGGVITSAGLILAGTFLALVAVDMVSLAQVGFVVAFGLLVDTFLVRCLLVPAIAVKLGDRSWWPLPPVAQAAAAVLAVLVGVFGFSDRAEAATITVTSVADQGSGTLREALEAAEAAPSRDEIRIVATGTINLATPLPDLHTAIAVDGPGAERLRVLRAADAPFRLLTVGPAGDVAVEGLTLTGGYVNERSNPRGGAVLNHGRLALSDVVVAGNAVEGRLGVTGGGGIANEGTLELRDSLVQHNEARSTEGRAGGGGVHNLGTLLVDASTVTANTGAAGIHHAAGRATVRGSTVAANQGDGIHNDFADLVVEGTTVAGNTAQVTAIGGTTEVRGATLSGPGVNLAGLQVDIPSWMSVEHTTLTGGAPNCHLTAQVEVRRWVGNRADDSSCPAEASAPALVEPAPGPPLAVAPEPVSTAAVAGGVTARMLAPLRIKRTGAKLRVTVPAAGTLRLSGTGVRTISRRARAAGTLTLKVQTARRTARIRLTFRPREGAAQERRLTIHLKSIQRGRGAK